MRRLVKKDIIKRSKFLQKEKKNNLLKYLSTNSQFLNVNLRKKVFLLLFSLKNSSLVQIQNRCVLTGRSKGLVRRFKVSRMALKYYANVLFIPGLSKQNN